MQAAEQIQSSGESLLMNFYLQCVNYINVCILYILYICISISLSRYFKGIFQSMLTRSDS